ncbi:MAG: class I SAM-dependent methyltransferase [Desulfobacterales bacterium]|nr:class I SAM-dependent methyltransferase [Desulfobacterales bacterium]
MTVKALFDAGALRYDTNRRQVIFCFDDFYGTLLDLVPFGPPERFSFLDLGAGTGLVSALVLARFPNAEAHLFDVSEKMLEKARERFADRTNVHFYVGDYDNQALPGRHQLVVSAMSIHHLSDGGKQRLTAKIFDALVPGGSFVHAELVLGATAKTEARYQRHWRDHLLKTDIGKDELARIAERMACDRPAALDDQLAWMREAGFAHVDCYFKHYNFSVYAGIKPEAA